MARQKPDRLQGLAALLERAGAANRRVAPVELWDPNFSGDLEMEILRDGTWNYLGGPITRPAMVRLFASILKRETDGETYMVTPVEKFRIKVADAAFVAVEMHAHGGGQNRKITVRTNTGDVVEAGAEHPLRFAIDRANGGTKPYILVRGRLEALFTRAAAVELLALVEAGQSQAGTRYFVRSNGAEFTVGETGNTAIV